MNRKRKVLFYRLVLTENPQISLFEDKDIELADKVDTLSKNHIESERYFIYKGKIIMLSTFDKNHIFGTFGKIEDINNGDSVRGRNRKDYSIESIQNLVEVYTYFYLDLNTNRMAYLNNSALPDIKSTFIELISSHFRISALYKVDLVLEKSPEIPDRFDQNIPINRLKVKYTSDTLPDNKYASEKEVLGLSNGDIRDATLNLSFIAGTTAKKGLFSRFRKDDYTKFEIETDEEIIDLIGKLVTKKATIYLEDDDLRDDEVIKNKLIQTLADEF